MGPEENREWLRYDLVHDEKLRQRLLDAMSRGVSSACTNTHTIEFDHEHQLATVFYELVGDGAPVELSLSDFAAFVQGSTTCTDNNCQLCALKREEPKGAPVRSKRGRR